MAGLHPNQRSGGEHYIGLMSGTSTDGVDAVLADFTDASRPQVRATASLAMPAALRAEFLSLNSPGHDELARAAIAGNQLADLYAAAVDRVLHDANMDAGQIKAIGAHGQTVRHDPEAAYTIQINAPARLAERTGIAVIADFRSRDIAAGGQGAPLVPAFHHALFGTEQPRVVLNLGGIANVTILRPNEPVRGFDTGPANVLLDTWISDKLGKAYDADGHWAASGRVNTGLLEHLQNSEAWLNLPPPKSTGRHLFNREWLLQRLQHWQSGHSAISDADVQSTLQALTVSTVVDAITRHAPDTKEVVVCGGGALNQGLMRELTRALPCTVTTTDRYGIPVQLVEALAFAWLGHAYDYGVPAGLPEVTGAKAPRVLGCRYPAGA